MYGSRSAMLTVILCGASLAWAGSTASAQDAVPGGWAAQVGFQAFSGPAVASGYGYYGFGSPMTGALAPYGGFAGAASVGRGGTLPAFMTQPQVANGLLPLADTVRRHGRRRAAR